MLAVHLTRETPFLFSVGSYERPADRKRAKAQRRYLKRLGGFAVPARSLRLLVNYETPRTFPDKQRPRHGEGASAVDQSGIAFGEEPATAMKVRRAQRPGQQGELIRRAGWATIRIRYDPIAFTSGRGERALCSHRCSAQRPPKVLLIAFNVRTVPVGTGIPLASSTTSWGQGVSASDIRPV